MSNAIFGRASYTLLALGLVLLGSPANAGKNNLYESYCYQSSSELGKSYSTVDPAPPVLASQLSEGDWVISKTLGLLQFQSFDPVTGNIVVRRANAQESDLTTISGIPQMGFAKLGTGTARDWMRARAEEYFDNLENFDGYFAAKGIAQITVEGRKTRADSIAWVQVQKIWDQIRIHYDGLKNLDAQAITHKWSFGVGGQGEQSHTSASRAELVASLKEFTEEYYKATGHNLIQGGILGSPPQWNPDGTVKMAGGKSVKTPRERLVETGPNLHKLLGGDQSSIPLDVYHHIVVETWKRSEENLGKLGQNRMWLMNYEASRSADPNSIEKKIRDFKDSGDITPLLSILRETSRAPGYQTWKENITQAGNGLMFVPTPGSGGDTTTTSAIAHWVQKDLGVGQVLQEPIQLTKSTMPQSYQSNLWDRIINAGKREYRLPSDIEGKTVVLVDDIITSGSTLEALKQDLLRNGAQSVYVFTLAKTGREPSEIKPESILRLAHASAEANPKQGTPAAITTADFFTNHAQMLNEVGQLPWSGKTQKQMTGAEAQDRKRFQLAFERNNLVELSHLDAAALEKIDRRGQATKSLSKSYRNEIQTDDLLLLELVIKLQGHEKDPDFARIRDSDLGQLVLKTAKQKADKGGPFRNQLRPELAAWLITQ